ncbi:hypothetical protein AZE42_03709 [Rhizopogon vesiculosus]|uniref:Uncharacterized protein n=1 Tax=Rhizopogon vesiculosus TaxID=180088 RepID=A0A1J8QNG3_9AGAM|nr:hypothetical protein AZE42_03709 [Rhizopogon vesiculosus]
MSLKALLISVLLLASITYGRPLVSLRDGAQQPEVVPFTGVNSSDPRMAHGPDGLRPAAAAIAMIIASEQSKGQSAPAILIPYEYPNTTPPSPTHLFVSPTTSNKVVPHTPMPSLRTPENPPAIVPAPQSNRSERNVLILAITVSTLLGLLVLFTISKYTLGCLRDAKRKFRFSQESWGHKEKVLPSISAEVAAPDTEAEEQSLRTFSFPSRPSRKVVRIQDPNEVPSEPSIDNRFSTLIAATAFRQSHPDHDSITTQDTTSTMPYLFKVHPDTQGDHLRTRSAPVITDDSSMSTVRPANFTESE